MRFLAVAIGGWTMARVAVLWPDAPTAAPVRIVERGRPTSVMAVTSTVEPAKAQTFGVEQPTGRSRPMRVAVLAPGQFVPVATPRTMRDDLPAVINAASVPVFLAPAATPAPTPILGPSPTLVETEPKGPRSASPRLSGSTFLIARPNGGQNLAFGQLGASQAGGRLTYALGDARRVALSGRLSTPLSGLGREAAAGLDWQPSALPVHLLIEERVPLDGGPARPAAQLIAGVARRLPLDVQFEAYAQAGAVQRRGGFADGAARLVRPVLERRAARLELGAGAWGAAQRGVTRVDVGPTLGLALPMRGGAVRLGVDYGIM